MELEGCYRRTAYVEGFLQDLCQGYHNQLYSGKNNRKLREREENRLLCAFRVEVMLWG